MKTKSFFTFASTIFLLIAVLHALRLIYGWEAMIGGVAISPWASWIALVVAGLLAWSGFQLARKK